MSKHIILSLSLLLPACDTGSDEPVELRSDPAPGCDFGHLDLNWNDDHANLPHECAAKLALCADQSVTPACDLQHDDCWAKLSHCVQALEVCWKSTDL